MHINELFEQLQAVRLKMEDLNLALTPLREAVEANHAEYAGHANDFQLIRSELLRATHMPDVGSRYF